MKKLKEYSVFKLQDNIGRFIALNLILVMILGCGSSDGGTDDNPARPLGEIDAELVGTWVGSVDGSFGSADMTMTLNSNGSLSAEGSTELYCPISGEWGVNNATFRVEGNDSCDGTSVSFLATRSTTSLSGSWNGSSGNSGTFMVTKQ